MTFGGNILFFHCIPNTDALRRLVRYYGVASSLLIPPGRIPSPDAPRPIIDAHPPG